MCVIDKHKFCTLKLKVSNSINSSSNCYCTEESCSNLQKNIREPVIIGRFLTNQTLVKTNEKDYTYLIRSDSKISFESYEYVENNIKQANINRFEEKQKQETNFYKNFFANKLLTINSILKKVNIFNSVINTTSLKSTTHSGNLILYKTEMIHSLELKQILELSYKEKVSK